MSRANARLLPQSLVFRLLAFSITLCIVVIVGNTLFLLGSAAEESSTAERTNAENRSQVLVGLITTLVEPEEYDTASGFSHSSSLIAAMEQPAPASAVGSSLDAQSQRFAPFPGEVTVVTAQDGTVVSPQSGSYGGLPTVESAMTSGRESTGLEQLPSGEAVIAVSVPILDSESAVIGTVTCLAPLAAELMTFNSLLAYPTAYIVPGSGVLDEVSASGVRRAPLPGSLAGEIAPLPASFTVSYALGGAGTVTGSFVRMGVSDTARSSELYVGVEVPSSLFAVAGGEDIVTVLLFALVALLFVSVGAVVFVQRSVRRPLSDLRSDVAQIAQGDFDHDIDSDEQSEIGDLRRSVNTMRQSLATNIVHLNGNVRRLRNVSSALTTTASGIDALHEAVVKAAAELAGEGGQAALLSVDHESFVAAHEYGTPPLDWITDGARQRLSLFDGMSIQLTIGDGAYGTAAPMTFRDETVGALAVVSREPLDPDDLAALSTLANYSAIAKENVKLFDDERNLVRKLRELDTLKTDFLSNAQHELRTPMTAMLGQIQLLAMGWREWDDGTKREYVDTLDTYAKQLNGVVESMIDFSLLGSSTASLSLSRVNVAAAAESALEQLAATHSREAVEMISVTVDGDLTVTADSRRFVQVLVSVLDNALKFSPEGGYVWLLARGEPGFTVIDVIDSGEGIGQEEIDHVYEEFRSGDSGRTRSHGGLGMGLALVKRIVDLHHAAITIESEGQDGTRVNIRWPA